MSDIDRDALIRMTAFEHVRRLGEVHGHLTADELKPGFVFEGERIPLVNPQRDLVAWIIPKNILLIGFSRRRPPRPAKARTAPLPRR